ncbi:MAG: FAD-dependent oxidoreductase, partial [Lentisphaeria bacterium]|nr:FAD-dependent oxidoreductase [Lentisphaeria bacterium]
TNKAMKQETQMIGGTKGSHIIVNHPELLQALDANMIYYENPEGRVCILYPFMGNVLIGSTDIPVDDPAEALCSPEEIDYIMESVASVFPDIEIKKSDIVFQYCGVRPLPRSNSKFTGRISRAHSCRITDADEQNHFKTYSMIGGKWTTFRGFADEVTEQVLAELNKKRQSTTEDIAIGGGLEFPRTDEACQQWLENLHGKTDIALDRLQILLERYGTIASTVADYISAETDSPLETLPEYSVRELEYIMKFERVMHLDDIVLRRTSIAIRGLLDSTVLNEISQIAQTVFDWSDSDTLDELKHCKDSLEKHHGIQFSGD